MKYVTEGYEPKKVLQFFEDISRIPRGSGNEKEVAQYLYDFGKKLGLDSYKDEFNNVVIKKKGSKGFENLPPIILQSHIDIVALKLPESDHDFLKDPLPIYIDGKGNLRSNGTTLGADNGNGVAYMMGVLEDTSLIHPPVECIFTANEEVGMIGASGLDKNAFTGKRMVNLDAGGMDQSLTVASCSGGAEIDITKAPHWQKASGEFIRITLWGLKGGHSACDIHLGRASAVKLMARIINHLGLDNIAISEISGGTKTNAIMSDMSAVISTENSDETLLKIEALCKEIKEEYKITDSGFSYKAEKCSAPEEMLTNEESKKFIALLLAIPSTMLEKSFELKDAVITSSNIGVVDLNKDEIRLRILARSSDASRLTFVKEQIKTFAEAFSYDIAFGSAYPGWKYNPDSQLRTLHRKLMKEIFDIDIKVTATHGGLECGVFCGKEPEMDIVCFGPKGEGAHTPDEYLVLESFKEMYEYLCRFLEELTK